MSFQSDKSTLLEFYMVQLGELEDLYQAYHRGNIHPDILAGIRKRIQRVNAQIDALKRPIKSVSIAAFNFN